MRASKTWRGKPAATIFGLLLLAVPCAAQESTSARLFVCYEGAGCPAVGSAREAEAQDAASVAAQRGPWYRSQIFWGTFFAEVGAALYDEIETTRALDRCPPPQCSETFTTHAGKRRALGAASFALERGLVILLWKRQPEAADGVMFAGTALRIGYHTTFGYQNSKVKAACPGNGAGCL